ncbi:MAG: ammonium transporter [Alphaproteobacteria bacterium]|nr:ammonium transporter [Alphaproteobacteria bacterium]
MSHPELLDLAWVILSTFLVLLMQAGFLCLETGLIRAKNSINVAIKNIGDLCLTSLLFWAIGFGFMFGASDIGLLGLDGFLFDGSFGEGAVDPELAAFFFFQLAFCGTSVTIVSGAVAERMSFRGYVVVAALLGGLVYPLFGHWAWGGIPGANEGGWLERLGFVDFAGSTVVHSIGGWVALAALILIGPRLGRFGRSGRTIEGHNLAFSVLGVFFLWIGWFGFNGGSTLELNALVPVILTNTLLAGAAGGVFGLGYSWWRDERPNALAGMSSVLAGLVAITANCHLVSFDEAILIGAIGGLIAIEGDKLLVRLQIDDAVSAVPVHLFAGVWGTLAVALFGVPAGEMLSSFGIQTLGVAAAAAVGLGISFPVLWIASRAFPLRVSHKAERQGLNIVEHGASSALQDLLDAMEGQRRTGDFRRNVPVEPFTEAGVIAAHYNRVVQRFNFEVNERERIAHELREAKERAEINAQAKTQFVANVSHELRTPLNAIIGFSDIISRELFGPVQNEQYQDYIRDIHSSGKHLLAIINDILDFSKLEADKMKLSESEVDVRDVVLSAMVMVRGRASEDGIALEVGAMTDLPALWADARALRQILLNLLSNAIKFTPEGGKVTVDAEIEVDGRMALIVADTGLGMAREDIPRALEPFAQITENAASYSPEGTGLGLPLTNAFARLHGGTLVISSTPGKGTTVVVRFPAQRVLWPQSGADRSGAPVAEAG